MTLSLNSDKLNRNIENVIVGNGLIARSFAGVDFGRPTLVLASGVSDSQEIRDEAFQREVALVQQKIAAYPDLHVVYCSTCSIDSGIETPYTRHKLDIERRVLAAAFSCHIFRLPQVVGLVQNRTLVSYFVDAILSGCPLKVQGYATRNLLDVCDFVRVASLLVRYNIGAGKPQNIASVGQVPVIDIVNEISQILSHCVATEIVDEGYSQSINNSFLRSILSPDDPLFDPEYWRKVLERYVPLVAERYYDAKAGGRP